MLKEDATEERKKERDEEDDKAGCGCRDEDRYLAYEENDGGDSYCHDQLQSQDGVNLPCESPAKLGALRHLRIKFFTTDHYTTLYVRFLHCC